MNKNINLYCIFKTMIIIGLIAFITIPDGIANAGVFYVTSAGDEADANPGDGLCRTSGGACTLRAAIDETNVLTGPNTIQIPALKIYLNRELRIEDHVGDDSVIIKGAGKSVTTIDGKGISRAFYFTARSGNHSISDLTIQNAINTKTLATERNGGGIFNEASLSLTNVDIKNSRAFQGGGVYNQHAFVGPAGENIPVLTLENVTISGNTATANELGFGGGGLFNGSLLYGNNVTITGNYAELQGGGLYHNSFKPSTLKNFVISNNVSKDGGGINTDLGDLFLEDGVIDSNESRCCRPPTNAYTGGGGIYHNEGLLTIKNVILSNNKALSAGGYGGAIYNSESLELHNVSIVNNVATYGAGIANGNYTLAPNMLYINTSTMSGNIGYGTTTIESEGGAIFNLDNGHILIEYSTITKNQAKASGGITNRTNNTYIEIKNTLLAENTDTYGIPDCRGRINSLGYNLFGKPNVTGGGGLTCEFIYKSTDKLNIAPFIGTLTIEGTVAYHPLLENSPAFDSGGSACPYYDTRGELRPSASACDIGAYEIQLTSNQNTQNTIFIPLIKK
jgi:CSLREA domain-containing protein